MPLMIDGLSSGRSQVKGALQANLQLIQILRVKNPCQVLLRNEKNWWIETMGRVSVLWMFIELHPIGQLQADHWPFHAISTSQDACIRGANIALGQMRGALASPSLESWISILRCCHGPRWSSRGGDALQGRQNTWTRDDKRTWQHTDERHTWKSSRIWIKAY